MAQEITVDMGLFSSLPQDIVVNILEKLPVKSLGCFMCTSKSWYNFIVEPNFIKRHRNYSIETNSDCNLMIQCYKNGRATFFTIPFSDVDDDDWGQPKKIPMPSLIPRAMTEILGSANGLICVHSSHKVFALWNPSIQKYKRLPSSIEFLRNVLDAYRIEVEVYSLFNMSIQRHKSVPSEPTDLPFCIWDKYCTAFSGFGYESVHDDYKLLRVVKFSRYPGARECDDVEVKVYSLSLNSWRRIHNWPYGTKFEIDSSSVHVNGAIHWAMMYTLKNGVSQKRIIAFDLKAEEFTEYCLPIQFDDDRFICLNAVGGCLCILKMIERGHEIWMMQQYGVNESWVKSYSIKPGNSDIFIAHLKPLWFSKDGKKILLHQSFWFSWYDIQRNEIASCIVASGSHHLRGAVFCVGSLLLQNCDTVTEDEEDVDVSSLQLHFGEGAIKFNVVYPDQDSD